MPYRTDTETRTALHWASMSGHVDVVEILLEAGASVDCHDRLYGFTPLMLAARQVKRFQDIRCHVWPDSFNCLQITRSDIRPHVKWAVSIVIADGHLVFLRSLCGYGWFLLW